MFQEVDARTRFFLGLGDAGLLEPILYKRTV